MPASAGRVRMPHNNRMSSSSALHTSDMWKNVIKYDPYAGNEESDKAAESQIHAEAQKGLLDAVKSKAREMGMESKRGACTKCGNVGHLTYQCRNHLGNTALPDLDKDSTSSSDGYDSDVPTTGGAISAATVELRSPPNKGKENERKREREEEKEERRAKKRAKKEKRRREKKERKRKKEKEQKREMRGNRRTRDKSL